MAAPKLLKPIPPQMINELAAYGPFNLKEYVESPSDDPATFSAALKTGEGLPKGLICTPDGLLTGIPARDTSGNYEAILTVENKAGSITESFNLTIKPSLVEGGSGDYIDKIKAQVWQALEQSLPIPDFGDIINREISLNDIYYLLERWGVITIWDAFNLEPPGEKTLLTLAEMNPHYYIYDRGSCLIGCPKDLFSYERTTRDGIMTAQILAKEAHKRNWTVELTGFEKYTRAAWVEIQFLNDKTGKHIEVMNYNPTPDDVKAYNNQSTSLTLGDYGGSR